MYCQAGVCEVCELHIMPSASIIYYHKFQYFYYYTTYYTTYCNTFLALLAGCQQKCSCHKDYNYSESHHLVYHTVKKNVTVSLFPAGQILLVV